MCMQDAISGVLMSFYYDDFLDNVHTSMELYAQTRSISDNGSPLSTNVWKSIGRSVISLRDSISGSVRLNWTNGTGNMIDSFMTGVSEGTQQAMQLLGKMESMANSFQDALNKDRETNQGDYFFLQKAQRKVYSASSFYPQYDGSEVNIDISPEFVFVTTSSNGSTAISSSSNMVSYLSPKIDNATGGALGIRTVYESPPNNYFNKQSGIGFQNYFGTYGLRIGSSAQFYPMLIDGYSINVSTQKVKLSNGNLTPLYVRVSLNMRPAGRFNAVHLFNMLTGSSIEAKSAQERYSSG